MLWLKLRSVEIHIRSVQAYRAVAAIICDVKIISSFHLQPQKKFLKETFSFEFLTFQLYDTLIYLRALE